MEGINIQIEPCKTYFNDGCIETAGTDETDLLRGESKTNSIKSTNNWRSWLFKQSAVIGYGALNAVDYLGESLANLFCITTPKYQSVINYHSNKMQEMNAEKIVNEENMKGFNNLQNVL